MTFFALITLILSVTGVQITEPSAPDPKISLKNQLLAYFSEGESSERAKLAKNIGQNYKFEEVLDELKDLDVWGGADAPKSHPAPWVVNLPSGQKATVQVGAFIETGAHPAVIHYSSQPIEGASAAQLGMGLKAVWITVAPPVGGTIALERGLSADLPVLLREIRKRVRLDRDRIYLFGERKAADSAWIAAMLYPTEFAGLIVAEGAPRVPYAEHLLALLLPNLRHVSFTAIWFDSKPEQPPSPTAVLNKAIADFATTAEMSFETATLAPSIGPKPVVPQRLITAAIEKPRLRGLGVSHWFRYLPQGNAGWVRATDLAGDVWEHEQISISAREKEDRNNFITQTLKEKLFYLSGRIEGQSIFVDTLRLGGVELRLSPDQLDFKKPVTITINGRQRFEGMLEPSINDLLESAYEDWDFQHAVHVRKHFSINAR